MAQKTLVPEEQFQFTLEVGLTPSEAKKAGREVTLRPDWESVKDGIMRDILLHKFQQNPDLKKKLLDTGEKYLEETNYWKDTYWGVCEGVGYNHLGKLLMSVRGELTTATS